MPLSDMYLRKLKAGDKPKHADGGGLYLFLSSAGGMLWRMDYRFQGKRKTLSFGSYPAVPLKDARAKREEARELLSKGLDPSSEKRRIKVQAAVEEREKALTFEAVAREWWETKTGDLSEQYRRQKLLRLQKHVFPAIGERQIAALEFSDLVAVIREVEADHTSDMPRRITQLICQVCKFARQMKYTKENLSADLSDVLTRKAYTVQHRAAITDIDGIGELLRRIDAYKKRGGVSMSTALALMPYAFLRSQELRGATWNEIDLDAAIWTVPGNRMKKKIPHSVPLSRQVVRMLRELRGYAVNEYLFPSTGKRGFITGEGLLKAIRAIGYDKKDMSVHGFRAIASTLLNGNGEYRPDVIEYQLAHKEKDASRSPYNRAQYDEERRKMMQEWADYLDRLRDGV